MARSFSSPSVTVLIFSTACPIASFIVCSRIARRQSLEVVPTETEEEEETEALTASLAAPESGAETEAVEEEGQRQRQSRRRRRRLLVLLPAVYVIFNFKTTFIGGESILYKLFTMK
jgi:hypothetical protein